MNKWFQKVVRTYFDSIYTSMCVERYETQLKLAEPGKNTLVLDCGCREGDNSQRMAYQIGTQRIIGIDYVQDALRQAKNKHIHCIQSNLNDSIPLENDSVDMVLATDVIEHLINPLVFVQQIYRVLKPSGYMILDTPNLASWHNIFALLIGIQPFSGPNITTMEDSDLEIVKKMHRASYGLEEEGEFVKQADLELTRHIIVIAYGSLISLLEKTGFTIEKAYGFGYYPLPHFLAVIFQRLDIRHSHHLVIKARK
jgi:SAM-dependent methyltransferase